MEKIKINLMSGSNLEKPLVTAFKSNNATYVVLDNEMNGTMGLPIILVSKLVNNTLSKIVDQNEWGAVKEALRMIISGNVVDYVVVEPTLGAEDVFFSQLTLPVASFDALKNNYHPNVENAGAVANVNPAIPSVPSGAESINNEMNNNVVPPVEPVTPVAPVAPAVENVSQPVNPVPDITPIMPQSPVGGTPETNVVTPSSESVIPAMPSAPAAAQTVAPVAEPSVQNASVSSLDATTTFVPNVEPIPDSSLSDAEDVPVDFTADKEAFLKACENMFDALVAKFKK